MSDKINEEPTVTSASTDLNMEEVRARREEIRESLQKLQELNERSRQLTRELSDTTGPLVKALKVLNRQLEPIQEAQKRMVRNLGFGDQFADLDEISEDYQGLLEDLAEVEYEEDNEGKQKSSAPE